MAAPAPLMPAHDHGARVFIRNVLVEACERLLRRLQEDDIPTVKIPTAKVPECDGVQRCAKQVLESVGSLKAPRDPQEVARLVSETCGCDLLPPRVLEAVAQRVVECLESKNNCQPLMRTLQRVILREEKLAAFFAADWSLSLFHEMKGLLEGKYWDRVRIQRGFLAEFKAAEEDPGAGNNAADPEVQLHGDGAPAANADPEVKLCVRCGSGDDPEVQVSAARETMASVGRIKGADPEVHVSAARETMASVGRMKGADPEVQVSAVKRGERTDLAIGDRRTELGFYIELKKNPKDKKTLQDGRKKLRALLSAERVSAPGNFNTKEENRVCYQIIFYTPDELAKASQRPEEMEKLLSKQSSWKHVINCYDETWALPKREAGACIWEVRPDY